ncbi:hypothetical protein IKF94_03165 [Candidatus Saccharibacteria bacterium]|nr:hypothetical protein [Candidatus Saccharibacteria bacterium]
MEKHSYWQKNPANNLFQDLSWNIPEQKTGTFNIIGGNSGSFSSIIHAAEYLSKTFPVKNLNILLPESLKSKVPPLPELSFLPATESGSFDKSPLLNNLTASADVSLFIGDLSKNSATSIAISDALKNSTNLTVLTRDSIDLVLPEMPNLIEREQLFLVGSLAQIQKVFRAVYYPKVLLLSMPLLPVIEALHKFTLSYPITILTYHNDQIIVANCGKVVTTPLEKTNFSPISLWSGNLAINIAANNFYSPNKPLEATTFSINYSEKLL